MDSEHGVYHLFIILNSGWNLQRVAIPEQEDGRRWYRVIDTSLPSGENFLDVEGEAALNPADFYLANPRTTIVLLGVSRRYSRSSAPPTLLAGL